ncbi:hypothetical protein BSKO_13696 [Bryopsis sp. KO-2023]|nr:hypothetical protein BSKO_13696 [Bryopsis sp. KO-2023]
MLLARFGSASRRGRNKQTNESRVLQALRSGDVDELTRLDLNGHDLSAKIDGEIPLYHACAAGQVEVVQYLLSIGADVRAGRYEYRRSLTVTPRTAKGRLIRDLLVRCDPYNRPGRHTGTNVPRAGEGQHFGEVFIAAKTGDVKRLRDLAARGKNIWLEHPVEKRTPLFYAAAGAHVEAVQYLLNSGAEDSDCMCALVAPDGPRGDRVRDMLSQWRRQWGSQATPISRVLGTMPSLDPHDLSCSSELPGELEPCLDAGEPSSPNAAGNAPLPVASAVTSVPEVVSRGPPLASGERGELAESGSLEGTCCVCLEVAAKFACVPCGHLCMCRECWKEIEASKTAKCPICRNDAIHALEIFNV